MIKTGLFVDLIIYQIMPANQDVPLGIKSLITKPLLAERATLIL